MTRLRVSARQLASRRARVIRIVGALPGAVAEGGRHIGFSVRSKRFGWYLEDHHGDGRVALHLKARPGVSQERIAADPASFHAPAYLGKKGWLGVWLDLESVDWPAIEQLLGEAYRLIAPRRAQGA